MVLPNKEHILCYGRNSDIKFAGQARSMKSYKQDQDGRWWRLMPIQATGAQNSFFDIIDPVNGNKYHGNWAFSETTIRNMIDKGKIAFPKSGKGLPTQIVYADEMKNDTSTIFEYLGLYESEVSSKSLIKLMDGKLFDFPKPIDLINFIVGQVRGKNHTILDFFSGSGTTAHAVMQLNAEDGGSRKHIQVQLPEPTDEKSEAYKAGYKKISDIARERINRAGARIKTDFADKLKERKTPFDVGYRTYKLSDTNFTKWQGSATADLGEVQRRLDLMRDSANDNASEADLLVEVMLKMGLPLTTRTTEQSVSGLTIHQAVHATNDDDTDTSEGAPVFYLNEHAKPTLEQLRAVVTELTPSKLVILEDAFQGDNELKTNLTQTCKSYDVELWTV
jgi:adenine-specific DNA-methyltransferase